jgi:Carbamoyl-phosphate synthase L chain, ATP binding domain
MKLMSKNEHKIESYSDLKNYLKLRRISACWYGPRSTDVSELDDLFNISGIISCYSSDFPKNQPLLTNEIEGWRRKCSIDKLAGMLVADRKLSDFVGKNDITAILPYDTNPELEKFCEINHINLFSSSDKLKDELRDKTKIDEISRAIGLPTIPGISGVIEEFEFEPLAKRFGLPLFLHFAEGAGGSGNRIVNTLDEFEKVKIEQKGKRLNAKKYFHGKTCTIDICVTSTAVICGTLEEELIGAEPLNSNPTEYVASSWFDNNYSNEIRKRICEIGVLLGKLLRSRGFIGCFHPDFLVGDDDEIFLTELNMRFGASCGAYTKIQVAEQQIPIFAIHTLSFTDPDLRFDADKINEENLQPLNYALLVLKNNFGRSITIPRKYKSGLYRLSEYTIEFIGDIKFLDFKDQNTILLIGLPDSDKDTVIEEGTFICEVMTRFPISDSKSKLNLEGKMLVEKIFSQFIT